MSLNETKSTIHKRINWTLLKFKTSVLKKKKKKHTVNKKTKPKKIHC